MSVLRVTKENQYICTLEGGIKRGLVNIAKKEIHNLYVSPNSNRAIKYRSMKWTRHVACMVEMKNAYKVFVRKA
jgi:hypothetical protein